MTRTRAREIAVAVVLPGVLLAAALVPALALADRLPATIAVHWGPSGLPDGAAGRGAALAALAALGLGGWGLLLAATARGALRRPEGRATAASAGLGIGLLAAVALAVVDRNLDAATWTAARTLDPVRSLALPAGAAALSGALAWVLAPGGPPARGPRPAAVALADGERAAWVARVRTPVGPALLVAAGAGLALAPPAGRAPWLLVSGVLVAAGVALSSVRVVVNGAGLTVGFGPWGRPAQHIPLARIAAVEVAEVEPLAYGGWGYRIRPGVTAVVLRRGEGLAVDLVGGGRYIVTVDGAAEAAGLLRAQLARTIGGAA